MSSNELVEQIMAQVIARVATPEQQAIPGQPQPIRETAMAEKSCSLTEFVGTAIGDTLGLVIANVDTALLDAMKLEKRYRFHRHSRRPHRRRPAHYGGGRSGESHQHRSGQH